MNIQGMGKQCCFFAVGLVMLTTAGVASAADMAGSNVISLGWLHIMPQNKSTPIMLNTVGGMPVYQEKAGTGFSAEDADTLGLTFAHYFTDNISLEQVGGIPVKLDFKGTGTLSSFGVLGHAKPIAPTVLMRYHFFDAQAKLRPYVGVGINYTKFVAAKVTNAEFVVANAGPGGSATVSATSSWSPAVTAGVNYALDDHWSVGLSATYVPLKTKATLTGTTARGVNIVSEERIQLRPITSFLNLGYRF